MGSQRSQELHGSDPGQFAAPRKNPVGVRTTLTGQTLCPFAHFAAHCRRVSIRSQTESTVGLHPTLHPVPCAFVLPMRNKRGSWVKVLVPQGSQTPQNVRGDSPKSRVSTEEHPHPRRTKRLLPEHPRSKSEGQAQGHVLMWKGAKEVKRSPPKMFSGCHHRSSIQPQGCVLLKLPAEFNLCPLSPST